MEHVNNYDIYVGWWCFVSSVCLQPVNMIRTHKYVETITKLCLLLVLHRFDESYSLFSRSLNIKLRSGIKSQSEKKAINVVYDSNS